MEAEKTKRSHKEEQNNEGSKNLLEKLREQLYSSNGSIRRQAGFNLSWMQEDGLEILKGSLFGDSPTTTKNAAAYGLRNMRGRMKKPALETLREGLRHQNSTVRNVCTKALELMGEKTPAIKPTAKRAAPAKLKIKEIPRRTSKRRKPILEQTNRRRPAKK
jgi:hypothetical protein